MNVILFMDGWEYDLLQRWRGVFFFLWGVGGLMVIMFFKEVLCYGMNQSVLLVVCSFGEVKVKNVKDIVLLEECLIKFFGFFKGKFKKKEVIFWLSVGIEIFECGLFNIFGM